MSRSLMPRHWSLARRLFALQLTIITVIVSGSLLAKDGTHSLYCAVIVKHVDAKTRSKTSINELLRS